MPILSAVCSMQPCVPAVFLAPISCGLCQTMARLLGRPSQQSLCLSPQDQLQDLLPLPNSLRHFLVKLWTSKVEALTRFVDPSDHMQPAGMQALRPKTSCLAAHRSLWQRPHASPVCSLHQHVWTARSRSSYHKLTLQRARTWRVARHGTCGLKVQAGWGDWFKKGDNTSVTRKEYQPQVRRALHICNSASTACWQPAVHSFCCQSLILHGAGCKGACLSCWPLPTQHASGIAPGVALSKHG